MFSTALELFLLLPFGFLSAATLTASFITRETCGTPVPLGRRLAGFFEEYLCLLLYLLIYVTLFPAEYLLQKIAGRRASVPFEERSPVVVIVHGHLATRSHWFFLEKTLRRHAGTEVIRFGYPSLFGSIDKWSDALAKSLEPMHHREIVLVGHSLGGLVAIRTAEKMPPDVVKKIITMGSPLHGTEMARFAITLGGKKLLPGTEEIIKTDEALERLETKLSCFWSASDIIIVPQSSATHRKAENIALEGMGHTGYHFWCFKGAKELLSALSTPGNHKPPDYRQKT